MVTHVTGLESEEACAYTLYAIEDGEHTYHLLGWAAQDGCFQYQVTALLALTVIVGRPLPLVPGQNIGVTHLVILAATTYPIAVAEKNVIVLEDSGDPSASVGALVQHLSTLDIVLFEDSLGFPKSQKLVHTAGALADPWNWSPTEFKGFLEAYWAVDSFLPAI